MTWPFTVEPTEGLVEALDRLMRKLDNCKHVQTLKISLISGLYGSSCRWRKVCDALKAVQCSGDVIVEVDQNTQADKDVRGLLKHLEGKAKQL